MVKVLYITGDVKQEMAFRQANRDLRKAGYMAINPLRLECDSYTQFLKESTELLTHADGIAVVGNTPYTSSVLPVMSVEKWLTRKYE